MAPKRQRTGKGKAKAGSSRSSLEFPDEFSPSQGFDVHYWDRDLEEVVNLNELNVGSGSWRRIYDLREACRHYMPSKYVDSAALDYFDMRDGVMYLLENIGWVDLLSIAYYTSSSMLHEFYSYLKVTKESKGGERIYARVEFNLGGFSFDYNDEEFARIFWFDTNEPCSEKSLIRALGMTKDEFWLDVNQTLFNEEYQAYRICKATTLNSVDIKYVHRVLTHSINGRAESNGNVNKWDQLVLYCMRKGLKFNGIQIILDMMQRHTRAEFKGRACGGGLVMLLAIRHGYPAGGIPANALRDNILVDTTAFAKVIYPPGENLGRYAEEEDQGAAGSDDTDFRDIPDDFSLSTVAQLTNLQ